MKVALVVRIIAPVLSAQRTRHIVGAHSEHLTIFGSNARTDLPGKISGPEPSTKCVVHAEFLLRGRVEFVAEKQFNVLPNWCFRVLWNGRVREDIGLRVSVVNVLPPL